jgi:diacylglycerol O-acyltransferase / wax synthase
MPPMLPQPATTLCIRMTRSLNGLPPYGKKYGTKMGNVLDPLDQTMFDIELATGATGLIQCAWVYNRPVDIDGLRRFHDHLQRGRLSRRIERSPLRFGRHRWISADGSSDIEIVVPARPGEEFDAWLNEQANTPLDCEHGPGWHLAVLPFTDRGAGVCLVISHCLADGVGLYEALADAAFGRDDPISWPAAASRRRWQALREDARQTARDAPAIGRAVVAALRVARRSRGDAGVASPLPRTPPALPAGADEPITLPTATIFVDADEWEARAHSLGGTRNALLAGVAARLAQRVGRVTADGLVALRMPVNERAAGDTRANASSNVYITVDPAPATTDLREIRAAIKRTLIRHLEVPDEEQAMLSLVPLLPKRLVRVAGGGPSVVSSDLGVINPAATRPDSTDADYFAMKLRYSGVTKAMMHRLGGLLVLDLGRACGQVFVSVIAYQPGRPNSNDGLRQDLSSALNDFSLTGTYL